MFPAIVSFLAMDEMVVEMVWVITANRDLIFRAAAIEILVKVGRVVIDHDDDAMGLGSITRVAVRPGSFKNLRRRETSSTPSLLS
jgi:hypothetical protein